MIRCVDLARNGEGKVSPNPLVGSVIVHEGKIIGEGWHERFGESHAEVNAIHSVKDQSLLKESTLYVNLEPCNHYGKTPPCSDLIIASRIPKVVIGMRDPNELVNGTGVRKLKEAGIEVIENVASDYCRELNKRFITYIEKRRPFVILKWAESSDHFLAPDKHYMSPEEFEEKRHITGFTVQKLVHRWRTIEDALMVGTNTVRTDNPSLNARAWHGRNPVRITIDRNRRLDPGSKLLDNSQQTIVFSESADRLTHTEYVCIDFQKPIVMQVLNELYQRKIGSLIVEGGANLLNQFIRENLWDEAQVFTTPKQLENGVIAPVISGRKVLGTKIDGSELVIFRNNT